jgi:hypothetical protein
MEPEDDAAEEDHRRTVRPEAATTEAHVKKRGTR